MDRRKTRRAFKDALVATVTASALLAGCGGSSGSAALTPAEPNGVVFVLPAPTSLAVKAAATLQAAATYPIGATGSTAVTWTVKCGSTACGTFSSSANAAGITYTAPDTIPTGGSVSVTATSVADPSVSSSATITIVGPIPIVVSLSPAAPASLQISASYALTAVITNDVSANPEVAWTVTCGATVCGSFNPTRTPSETNTIYSAPATIPAGGSVTVTATSITDPAKSVSAHIAITAVAPTLANGTYVFQVSGPIGSQASFVTGALVAKNGKITGGEQDSIGYSTDVNDNPIGAPVFSVITGGNYGPTSDGNLQISIDLGPNAVETLIGTVVGTGSSGFVGALNGAPVSGTLQLQIGTVTPSMGYAMSLFGGDSMGTPMLVGGVINVDGPGTISGAGSELDVVDGQAIASGSYPLAPGTVSAPDAYGRTQIQLLQGAASQLPSIYLAGYVVDSMHLRLIEISGAGDAADLQGVLGGSALGQGSSTAQFSAASIAGSSYVFAVQGEDAQGALQIAGVFEANANGSVSGTLNWNDLSGKTTQSPLPFTGLFTIDVAGRVTLTHLTDGASFEYSLHGYLAAGGNLLLISNDSADIFVGQGYQQQASALTAGAFSGTYGLNSTVVPNMAAAVPAPVIGSVTATADGGNTTANGFADLGTGGPDFAISGSFTGTTSGILGGTLAGFNRQSPSSAGSFALYLIDSSRTLLIETDANQLTLGYMQNGP